MTASITGLSNSMFLGRNPKESRNQYALARHKDWDESWYGMSRIEFNLLTPKKQKELRDARKQHIHDRRVAMRQCGGLEPEVFNALSFPNQEKALAEYEAKKRFFRAISLDAKKHRDAPRP